MLCEAAKRWLPDSCNEVGYDGAIALRFRSHAQHGHRSGQRAPGDFRRSECIGGQPPLHSDDGHGRESERIGGERGVLVRGVASAHATWNDGRAATFAGSTRFEEARMATQIIV